MKEPDEIDFLFQSALEGLEISPDPSVKENIDRAIASKKKRRIFLFILFPVLVGATGLGGILLSNFTKKKSAPNTSVTAQIPITGNNHASNSGNILGANTEKKKIDFSAKSPVSNEIIDRKQESLTPTPHTKSTILVKHRQEATSNSRILPTGISTIREKEIPNAGETPLVFNNIVAGETDQEKLNQENANDPVKETPAPLVGTNLSDTTITASITETLEKTSTPNSSGKWSLSALTYWEGEKKRSGNFSDAPFAHQKRENAHIHSSSFYGKVEINRKLTPRFEILAGIGFRTSKLVEYAYLSKIVSPLEGATAGVPQPNAPADTIHYSGNQSFRVNSILFPIGAAYAFPLGNQFQLRLSGGGEFAYGAISGKFVQPGLSGPDFNPFGCSVWLRPEIHCSFGRTHLFGFGSFNQALSQQLKWNFDIKRNPAFGGGIGLRIDL